MKKTLSLLAAVCCLLTATIAQNPNNPNAKLNLVVGNFSGDYSNAQRINVIRELCNAHRTNVIEQGVYNALPQNIRDKMRIDAVITGKCTITTERKESKQKQKDGTQKTVINYETNFTTDLTLADPATGKAILTPVFKSSATKEDRDESIKAAIAIGHTEGKTIAFVMKQLLTLDEFLEDKYPLHGKIITIDEMKKNTAQKVTVSLGSRDAIYRGQTYEIVSVKNGKEKNYGKLRVREINSDTTSTLSVEKGGKDIIKAFENGDELQVVSYVQALSLNGIVRVEQEAPRLNTSSPDDAKRRNVALAAINGNAPSDFVAAVKQQFKSNRRINAHELGTAGCPATDQLDGIAYGHYTGMHTSSRLVKAEDNLLQLKDYTEYSTFIGWYLFIIDPRTGDILYSGNQSTTATSDKSADDATRKAIQSAADITSATYSAFPLIGNILTVDDEKAKTVTIDLGNAYPVYNGLRFDVYTEDPNGGWEKIGRIEVQSITDASHATCHVKKGGERIRKALEENHPTRISTFILKEFFDL